MTLWIESYVLMFTCERLSIKKSGQELFSDLSFTLFPGAIIIVRGGNGCGKTSLLNILSGRAPPSQGAIVFDGELQQNHAFFADECQMVGHHNALKPYLTVEENLLFWAQLCGGEQAMPIAIALWQLQEVLDAPVETLSQGMQRRVALARLLVCPGRIWLLDEPMANLDAVGINLLERVIRSRSDQGGIILITSHIELDIPEAKELWLEDFCA